MPEGRERQSLRTCRRGGERGPHVEQAPVAHAGGFGRQIRGSRGTHAAIVVDQRFIAALGRVTREFEIESLGKTGAAADHDYRAPMRGGKPMGRELTSVGTAQGKSLGCGPGCVRGGRGTLGYLPRRHNACASICFASARITSRRALDLRHTAPMVRVGMGFANGRMVTPRALPYAPRPASSGNSVM